MTQLPAPVAERAIQQLIAIYIRPAVEQRRAAGTLSVEQPLVAWQVVFFPDGRRPIVRLNEEVRAIIEAEFVGDGTKQPGEPMYLDEIGAISRISLADEPNCGHATMVQVGSRPVFGFDARYDRERAREHLDLAEQFLGTARLAWDRKWLGAFVDNLFSASELCAKATLLLLPDPRFRAKASHAGIAAKYKWFTDLGNVDDEFRSVLSLLDGWRVGARYLGETKHRAIEEGEHSLAVVTRMLQDARERLA